MPESTGLGVSSFLLFIFLWPTSETGIRIPFLSFYILSPYLLQVEPSGEGGPYELGCLPMLRSL